MLCVSTDVLTLLILSVARYSIAVCNMAIQRGTFMTWSWCIINQHRMDTCSRDVCFPNSVANQKIRSRRLISGPLYNNVCWSEMLIKWAVCKNTCLYDNVYTKWSVVFVCSVPCLLTPQLTCITISLDDLSMFDLSLCTFVLQPTFSTLPPMLRMFGLWNFSLMEV